MSPVTEWPPLGKNSRCEILPDGTIKFPQLVLNEVGWRIGDYIVVAPIFEDYKDDCPSLVTLLFRKAVGDEAGFKLSYLNRNGQSGSGGKLRCARLMARGLRPRVRYPMHDIEPLLLEHWRGYDLGFIVQLPCSTEAEFSAAGVESVSSQLLGVYTIVDNVQGMLRVGEGLVASRVREHLKVTSGWATQARQVQYFRVSDKAVSETVERLFLVQYKGRNKGLLPPGNAIMA